MSKDTQLAISFNRARLGELLFNKKRERHTNSKDPFWTDLKWENLSSEEQERYKEVADDIREISIGNYKE